MAETSTLLHPPAKLHYALIVRVTSAGQPESKCHTFAALTPQEKHLFIQHSGVGQPMHDKEEEQQNSGWVAKKWLFIK